VSLKRLIFYSAMIGGWAAFAGWLVSELFLFQRTFHEGLWGFIVILLAAALIGGCIAGGLTLLGGVANGSFRGQWHRFLPGFLGGMAGGAVGSLLGNSIFLVVSHWVFLVFGWTLMGLAIGAVEGIYDKSPKKLRNGLIGGGLGGLLGGVMFNLLGATSMAERATAFVILGMCIGCFVGLAQVILKEAWLTVEAGFRPGRQLLLSTPEIVMGTSERAALPFIAFGAKGVEPVHARILRRDDGTYVLEDNRSRTGTFVNGRPVQGAVLLRNEDVIQLGVNLVRFREVHRHVADAVGHRADPQQPQPVRPIHGVPVMAQAIASGMPPAAKAGPLPTAMPVPAAPSAILPGVPPRASPSVAALPVAKVAPPPQPGFAVQPGIPVRAPARPAAPPPAAPTPPAVPATAAPVPFAPQATAPGTPTCPICGRPGAAIPQSAKRRCLSCGINF
jgi:hypothetical protein